MKYFLSNPHPGSLPGRERETNLRPMIVPLIVSYTPTASLNRRAFCVLALAFLLPSSCDQLRTQPLTGHRDIAAALRPLLDLAYAGPDYPTYHAEFQSFQTIVQQKIAITPHEMRPHVHTIVAYLQVADKVLEWHTHHHEERQPPQLTTWTTHHPFLKAAIGARLEAPNAFDAETALQLLFEKTDQTLVAMQVKNKPI